jgi:hypothetical protein
MTGATEAMWQMGDAACRGDEWGFAEDVAEVIEGIGSTSSKAVAGVT